MNEGVQKGIPKSYEFERDLDKEDTTGRVDWIQFTDKSNEHFVHQDINYLLDTEEGLKELVNMIRIFFNDQTERLDVLADYSRGENTTILSGQRRLEKNKSDKRIRHPFGGYISSFITGFIAGKPVTVSADDKGSSVDKIDEIHAANDINTLNYDLMYDASRYGRAFELHIREQGSKTDQIYLIDPQEMFVIRSADVTKKMIAAVHCPNYNGQIHLTVYTDDKKYTFKPFKPEGVTLSVTNKKKHLYNMVPVVEWWGNRYRRGDFEPVISAIDAYDSAQSDTANYMSDLNDAMLVISGDIKSAGYESKDFIAMKDANMMMLESAIAADGSESKLSAQYLYKQYDVQGAEAYKDRIERDIFKYSNIPDLVDEKFGTSSGVAIQYKLVALRQLQATKESYFQRALRRRYRIIENLNQELNNTDIDADELIFTFHPNLPEDVWSEVEKFVQAGGDLSQETLRELASFTSQDTEKERLEKEASEEKEDGLNSPRLGTDEVGADDADEE